MIQALVKQMGVKIITYTSGGGYTGMTISRSHAKKLQPMIELHAAWVANGGPFLGDVDEAWAPYAKLMKANLRKTRRLGSAQ